VNGADKPLAWLKCEIKTPPFGLEARIEAGALLRRLQHGESIGMPHSRPMPSIGPRCHELRVRDADKKWRIIYRIDADAIVVAGVFAKKTQKTPRTAIDTCVARLAAYDRE
jgi:phage-related protein